MAGSHRPTRVNEPDQDQTAELPIIDIAATAATKAPPPAPDLGDVTVNVHTLDLDDTLARTDVVQAPTFDLGAVRLSDDLRDVEERLTRKSEKLAALEKELNALRTEHDRYVRNAEALTIDLASQIETLTDSNESEVAAAVGEARREAAARLADAEGRIAALRVESEQALRTLSESHAGEKARGQEAIGRAHDAQASAEARASRAERQIVEHENELQVRARRIDDLQGELARSSGLVRELGEQRDLLRGNCDRQLEALHTAEAYRGVIDALMLDQETASTAREQEMGSLVDQVSLLPQRNARIVQLEGELATLRTQGEQQVSRISLLTGEAKSSETRLAEVTASLAAAERSAKEQGDALRAATAQATAANDARALAEKALAELRAARDAELAEVLAARDSELAAVRAARDTELATERAARETALATERAARETALAAEREAREAAVASERAARESAVASERTTRETTLAEERAAHEAALAQATAKAADLARLQDEHASLEGELAARETAIVARETAIGEREKAAAATIESQAELLQRLQGSVHAAEERASRVEGDLQAAEEQLRQLELEKRRHDGRIDELTRGNETLQARLGEAERKLEEREVRVRRLESEAHASAAVLGTLNQSIQRLREDTGSRPAISEPPLESMDRMLIRTDGEQSVLHRIGRRTTIGRTPDNDVQLDASFVSRHHAVILASPRTTLIEDLNSTNGVIVNGRRVTRQALHDGDQIAIGMAQFRFELRPSGHVGEPV